MDHQPTYTRLRPGIASPAGAARVVPPFAWPTLALLRSVPAAALRGGLTDEHLLATARLVAEDARGQGLTAERLLVGLKQAWAECAEVRQLAAHDARDLLDRLVSLCIRAYYGSDDGTTPADRLRAAGVHGGGLLTTRHAGDARIA